MSGSLFLFLAIFGKVMLLRSVRGKVMTRIKWEKLSELKNFYAKKILFGIQGAVPRSSILTILDKVEFEKSMSVEVFVGISAQKEKKKEKSWSEESLWNI